MFNNFNLTDEEIIKIIEEYKPLLLDKSMINYKFDEDLYQELKIRVFIALSKNRNK
ncbi:MAG: helix-turn-helix domain-containing protein [Clostridia bacterium]|nr:helix-turn-helix domain-containing protein [Clostridia bacterium]